MNHNPQVRWGMRSPRPLTHACLIIAFALAMSGCNRGAQPAHLGRVAPDFTVSDGERTIHLGAFRGKVVLLNLWWSNCGPCIQETPALVALQHQRPDLAILAVSIDQDPGSYHRFLQRFHVDLTTVRDPNQTVAKMYGTDLWPETYIIDRKGIIRRKVVGDPDWSNPEIRAFLQGL
jgi:peroxiredoxin